MWSASVSLRSFISMVEKPSTALIGVPSPRVSGGSAWKARNRNPEPSMRKRCRRAPGSGAGDGAAPVCAMGLENGPSGWEESMPSSSSMRRRLGARLQHIFAPAIGAVHRAPLLYVEIVQRVAERPAAAVAADDLGLHLDDLMRVHARSRSCFAGMFGGRHH